MDLLRDEIEIETRHKGLTAPAWSAVLAALHLLNHGGEEALASISRAEVVEAAPQLPPAAPPVHALTPVQLARALVIGVLSRTPAAARELLVDDDAFDRITARVR